MNNRQLSFIFVTAELFQKLGQNKQTSITTKGAPITLSLRKLQEALGVLCQEPGAKTEYVFLILSQ